MKKLLIAAVVAATPLSAVAGEGHVVELARKAVDKGYGATCSLEAKPVEAGGYFPCLDFGPYRLVFSYGAVKGYVVQKGREPFLILSGPADDPDFVRGGPWTADMPARLAMWWNDVVDGGAARQAERQKQSDEERAAQEYVSKLMGKTEPTPAVPAPTAPESPPPAESQAAAPVTSPIGDDIKQILAH